MSIIIIYFLDKNRFDVKTPYVYVIMRGYLSEKKFTWYVLPRRLTYKPINIFNRTECVIKWTNI